MCLFVCLPCWEPTQNLVFEVRLCHATHPQSQPVITEGRVESQECVFDKETQSRTGPPLAHVLQQVIFPHLSYSKTKVPGSQGPAGAHRAYGNHSMELVLNLPFCSALISPEIKTWPKASLQSCYLPLDCQGFLTHVGCLYLQHLWLQDTLLPWVDPCHLLWLHVTDTDAHTKRTPTTMLKRFHDQEVKHSDSYYYFFSA